jgi:hypothetical protein
MAGLTFHSGRRLADHPELVVAIEQEAAIIDSLAPAGLDVERLFFQAEDVERALKELGPTGTYAEGLVKTAALAAVHVMRGGRLEVAAVPSIPSPANRLAEADQLAQLFHETYERLAPDFGYRTREASAVPWAEVPENNRRLMVATAAAIIDSLAPAGLDAASSGLDALVTALGTHFLKDGSPCFCPRWDAIHANGDIVHQPCCRMGRMALGYSGDARTVGCAASDDECKGRALAARLPAESGERGS